MREESEERTSGRILVRGMLGYISGGTLLGMILYETAKEFLLPSLSKWESHLITIVVTVLLVTLLTAYALRMQNNLRSEISRNRRAAESAQRHLALIVESSDDAIISIDPEGRILSFNPGAERIFGFPVDSVLNHQLSLLIPPEIPDRTAELIDQAKTGTVIRHDRGVFLRSDGSRIHLSVTATPLPGSLNRPGSVSIIARDISDQIAREEMLTMIHLKQHLLTATTRHDIKNILSILMGFSSLLSDRQSDPEISRIAAVILDQSEKIHAQVMFMEAYESLGSSLPAWQEADTIFSRAISGFQAEQGLFSSSLGGLFVYADPLIEKVIYNLCDNAIRYGGRLTGIRTSFVRDGDSCRWIIEDDGVGIRTDLKEKIFENGFGQTTGLGLYLAREILSITKIRIQETGTPDEGARFELIIPAGCWRIRDENGSD